MILRPKKNSVQYNHLDILLNHYTKHLSYIKIFVIKFTIYFIVLVWHIINKRCFQISSLIDGEVEHVLNKFTFEKVNPSPLVGKPSYPALLEY